MGKDTLKEEITRNPADELRQAFAARDALTQSLQPDPAALEAADRMIMQQCLKFESDETFDPVTQPVMSQLAALAKRKQPMAIRLLLQRRVRLNLYQSPGGERPLPDEYFGCNGLTLFLPRGKSYQVPELVAEVLSEAGVR